MYAYVYQGYIHTYIQSHTNQVKGVLSPAKQARPSPFNQGLLDLTQAGLGLE